MYCLATGFFILVAPPSLYSQVDSLSIKQMYDRAMEFDELKLDSFDYYIEKIGKDARSINYDKGDVLTHRLRGIKAEFSGEYEKAIGHYLNCLEISRKQGWVNYEHSALTDLGIIYSNIKNPSKAKEYYREAAMLAGHRGEEQAILNSLTNLGAICNQLHETDSALYYLNMASNAAAKFKQPRDLTSLRNNLGNAWFAKGEYEKSLGFFRQNYGESLRSGNTSQLWYDVLNMGDVMIELGKFDSAKHWIDLSLELAQHQQSKRKEADVHQLYAKLYERMGNDKRALASLRQWYMIDTSLVNAETKQAMLAMENQYTNRQRVQENKLLQSQVEAGTLRSRNLLIALLSIATLAIGIAVFLYYDRKQSKKLREINALVQAQNDKLADLNAEKNSLISMVSHDLHTPFTTIQMWAQVLDPDKNGFGDDERKAIERIRKAADNGEKMINRILDVEGSDVNRKRIQLETIPVQDLLKDVANNFQKEADQKKIRLDISKDQDDIDLLTDKQLLERALSNLLSNAVKFSPPGGRICLEAGKEKGKVVISVTDQGPGISAEDQKKLFSKYGTVAARPTAGEKSTGLGLFIVHRIMQELQGDIRCQSEPGQGTKFTLVFRS